VRERWGLRLAAAHVRGEAVDAVRVVAFDSAAPARQGLVFVAFNQDIDCQFATIQRRLAEEPMIDYINSVGGCCFFAPPGSRGPADWVDSGLFA
jgi:deferrochelatase/peroxidase EfeB